MTQNRTYKLFDGTDHWEISRYLNGRGGVAVGISNGDIVKATIVGNVISAYINNVLVSSGDRHNLFNGKSRHGVLSRGGHRFE